MTEWNYLSQILDCEDVDEVSDDVYGTPHLTPTLRKLEAFDRAMEKHNEMMRSQLSETLEEMIAEEFDEEVTVTFGGGRR